MITFAGLLPNLPYAEEEEILSLDKFIQEASLKDTRFEEILIEELNKQATVTAVVKGGPIINDVILEDAIDVGLTRVCEVIDNGDAFIGAPLNLIPPSFRARMDAADMLIAKGQGNYETLDTLPGDMFLILKAKCEIVARHMGVAFGQVALISTRARERE